MTVAEIDAEFLPLIYDIVKCVERDPGDAAAKNKVSAPVRLIPVFSFAYGTVSIGFFLLVSLLPPGRGGGMRCQKAGGGI